MTKRSVRTPKKTPNAKSLKNLRPPWQRGECPNPGGRPKTKPLLAALQQELAENPERLIEIVDKVLTHAKHSLGFFCELRDMLDGKPGIKLEGPEGGIPINFELNVHFVDPEETRRQMLLNDAVSEGANEQN